MSEDPNSITVEDSNSITVDSVFAVFYREMGCRHPGSLKGKWESRLRSEQSNGGFRVDIKSCKHKQELREPIHSF